MSLNPLLRTAPIAVVLAAAAMTARPAAQARPPIGIDTARVTIAGSSNIHEYTAATTTVQVTRVKLAAAISPEAFWSEVLKPGALEAFEIAIPAASLSSPKDGLDKNMHKALKVEAFPLITFRLTRFEGATADGVKAIGVLRIAGVEREVVLALKTTRKDGLLVVTGSVPLLMTDYGIKPPTAMLGMLKTDPKVTVSFETILAVPLT
jgi:polyisoprenoid-binding protein YceI